MTMDRVNAILANEEYKDQEIGERAEILLSWD